MDFKVKQHMYKSRLACVISDNCWRTPLHLTCAAMTMYAAESDNCGDMGGVKGNRREGGGYWSCGVVEPGIGARGDEG